MLLEHLRPRYRLALALLGSPLVAACSKEACTLEARAGLTVTVYDARAALVCDAVVTARDGTLSERLMLNGCTYSGVYERAGTYSVEVVAGSTSKTVPDLVVSSGECHVNGLAVTVVLDADNASDGGGHTGDGSADRDLRRMASASRAMLRPCPTMQSRSSTSVNSPSS